MKASGTRRAEGGVFSYRIEPLFQGSGDFWGGDLPRRLGVLAAKIGRNRVVLLSGAHGKERGEDVVFSLFFFLVGEGSVIRLRVALGWTCAMRGSSDERGFSHGTGGPAGGLGLAGREYSAWSPPGQGGKRGLPTADPRLPRAISRADSKHGRNGGHARSPTTDLITSRSEIILRWEEEAGRWPPPFGSHAGEPGRSLGWT